MQDNIVVLGLGNLLLGDEGLGIRALEQLMERYDLPEAACCIDGGVLGLELLAYVEGATHLLVIDAIQTGQEPGTLIRLEGDDIPATLALKLSMHQLSFQEVLGMSRLRGTTPPRLVVLGIEPAVLDTGIGLSETVQATMESLVGAIVAELRGWNLDVAKKSCVRRPSCIGATQPFRSTVPRQGPPERTVRPSRPNAR